MSNRFRGYRWSIKRRMRVNDPNARILRLDDYGDGIFMAYWATNDGGRYHLNMVVSSIEAIMKRGVISLDVPQAWTDNHRRPRSFPHRFIGLFLLS